MKRLLTLSIATIIGIAGLASGTRGAIPFDQPTGGSAQSLADGGISHVANISYKEGSDLEFIRRGGRDYAIAGVLYSKPRIIDITDPTSPTQVATINCTLYQNDIQISGTIAVLAADSSSSCKIGGVTRTFLGFATADISDPTDPKVLGIASISRGAHNVTVHPTKPLVYVSDSDLYGVGYVRVWDISDPADPEHVRDIVNGAHSPHDITFNADGTRAYVASISHIDIFDSTAARNPSLITTIADPAINIVHQADPTPDGRFLIVSDELGGAAAGVACPGGGLHVYDVSLDVPVKVGVFWADSVRSSGISTCTSHVFRINPDGVTMAIAWYTDGVHVLDFSDLIFAGLAGSGNAAGVGVKTVAWMKLPGADTWAAKMWQTRHPGYVFANDMGRGFDVFYVPELS